MAGASIPVQRYLPSMTYCNNLTLSILDRRGLGTHTEEGRRRRHLWRKLWRKQLANFIEKPFSSSDCDMNPAEDKRGASSWLKNEKGRTEDRNGMQDAQNAEKEGLTTFRSQPDAGKAIPSNDFLLIRSGT